MTAELFNSWLISLNKKFKSENRHVLLFLDNASSHPHTEFSKITLKFFPQLCTAALQPLDQGIIRCFKAKYRTNLIRKLLSSLDSNDKADTLAKRVTILDALYWIRSSARELTNTTVRNCFHKAGFRFDEWNSDSNECPNEVHTKYFENQASNTKAGSIDLENVQIMETTEPDSLGALSEALSLSYSCG